MLAATAAMRPACLGMKLHHHYLLSEKVQSHIIMMLFRTMKSKSNTYRITIGVNKDEGIQNKDISEVPDEEVVVCWGC